MGRFDDMVSFLQEVVKCKSEDFTTEERNLLSVGFKNQIGSKRTAIRTISAIEQNPKYQKFNEALQGYKKKIEGELYEQCMSIVENVKDKCMKVASTDETKAFFYKMIGDYYRYVAECADADKLETVKNGAWRTIHMLKQACELGENALSAALEKIDDVDEETFRDAKSII